MGSEKTRRDNPLASQHQPHRQPQALLEVACHQHSAQRPNEGLVVRDLEVHPPARVPAGLDRVDLEAVGLGRVALETVGLETVALGRVDLEAVGLETAVLKVALKVLKVLKVLLNLVLKQASVKVVSARRLSPQPIRKMLHLLAVPLPQTLALVPAARDSAPLVLALATLAQVLSAQVLLALPLARVIPLMEDLALRAQSELPPVLDLEVKGLEAPLARTLSHQASQELRLVPLVLVLLRQIQLLESQMGLLSPSSL